MSGFATRRGPIWPWALIHAAVLIGGFAADVAVTEAIDGAATPSEEHVLRGAAALAVLSLSIGAFGYVRSLRVGISTPNGRRRLAYATAWTAGLIGLGRVAFLGVRLIKHIRLERDEPLTTMSLAIQIVVSMIGAGSVVAFAVHQLLLVRRSEITAFDAAQGRTRHQQDVGRDGHCPTN